MIKLDACIWIICNQNQEGEEFLSERPEFKQYRKNMKTLIENKIMKKGASTDEELCDLIPHYVLLYCEPIANQFTNPYENDPTMVNEIQRIARKFKANPKMSVVRTYLMKHEMHKLSETDQKGMENLWTKTLELAHTHSKNYTKD